MSRKTIYHDNRFHLVTGDDHAVGTFLQLFDQDMLNETPEGEGLVLDWDQMFGMETNYTGLTGINALDIAIKYLENNDVKLKQ
jgi:hypothetical protein